MRRDLLCGAIGLVLAAVYYLAAQAIPISLLSDAVGPGGIPKVLGVCLAVLSLALMGSCLVARKVAGAAEPAEAFDVARHARAFGIIGMGFAYVVLAPWLGYLLTLTALLVAAVIYFGGKPSLRLVATAVAGAAFLWVMFAKMLSIPMPVGLWSRLSF